MISPGESNPAGTTGAFWVMVADFMKAAAKDLNINFEVLYAERDYLKMIDLAENIIQRENKPDYVILVNEKLIVPKLLTILNKTDIKVFLMLNDLTDEQKIDSGHPRGKYSNWIGSIIPNQEYAGVLIAQEIIREGLKELKTDLKMIAINGSRVTLSSVGREVGLKKVISDYSDSVMLNQILYCEWRKDLAFQKTRILLERYPDTNIIWAANDPMALGALEAVKESGRIPGKDIYIGGLNWSSAAIDSVLKNEMVATVGGHFMLGGWALVLINDYHNGFDFRENEGLEILLDGFSVLDIENVNNYQALFGGEDWDKIDFRNFSKSINQDLNKYDFSLKNIFNQL